MDHNPYLAPDACNDDSRDLAAERIEAPGGRQNIVWQNRAAPPTEYENTLADTLVSIFEKGVDDLETLVGELNARGVKTPGGEDWSAEAFERIMLELGR